jgi:hypothetical protein
MRAGEHLAGARIRAHSGHEGMPDRDTAADPLLLTLPRDSHRAQLAPFRGSEHAVIDRDRGEVFNPNPDAWYHIQFPK